MVKAGAQRLAAELGLALIAPDTSPRGAASRRGEATAGTSASAPASTSTPRRRPGPRTGAWKAGSSTSCCRWWARHFPIDVHRIGIFGHSMGGHGALTLALRHPGRFAVALGLRADLRADRSAPGARRPSAATWAPIASSWLAHDASALMQSQTAAPYPEGILIDQGLADKFLADQLHPHLLEAACRAVGPAAHAAPARGLRPRLLLHRRASWPTTWRTTPGASSPEAAWAR